MKRFSVFSAYAGLPRSIYVLFFARIINRMGDFVNLIMTFFLTERMGVGADRAGTYVMAVGISSIIGTLISGKMADHMGRKKIMLSAQVLSALCFIPCGFLGKSMWIPYLMIAASFFNGAVRPASSAIIADLTKEEERKKAFALLYLGINIGVAIGPMIAGFLYKDFIQWIFWGDAITTFMAVVLVFLFVPETMPSREVVEASKNEIHSDEKAEEGSLLIVLCKRPVLILFCLLTVISSFVYAQHAFAIPLQLNQLYGQDGAKLFGGIMSFNAVIVLVFTTVLVQVTRNIKPIINIAIASLFYAVGFGMLYIANSYPLFMASTFLWTIGEIMAVTNQNVYIASHTPMSHRGRFNAVTNTVFGVGHSAAPKIAGFFIIRYGVMQIWPNVAILALLSAGGLMMLSRIGQVVPKKQLEA
jgi:MFS family permease